DCDGIKDNNGAENEMQRGCYYKWQQEENGVWHKINGLDHPEMYGNPDVGICSEGFEICTIDCYDPALPEPGAICREGALSSENYCCREGVVGGNQMCYGVQFALPEICNCLDDDCDGSSDEGLRTETLQDFVTVTDCSGSMSEELGDVRNAFTSVHFPECFNDEIIRISTVFVGDPTTSEPELARALVPGAEFGASYGPDLDAMPAGSCSGVERTLDAVAYIACAERGMEENSTCLALSAQRIQPWWSSVEGSVIDYFLIGEEAWPESLPAEWSEEEVSGHLHSLRREVWREGADYHIIFLSDEKAQTAYPELLNQMVVGSLLREAGISIDLYINVAQHYNFFVDDGPALVDEEGQGHLSWEQGYGYLVYEDFSSEMVGINPHGNIYDLSTTIASEEGLGRKIRNTFIYSYCENEEEE
ncbi:MAG: hypothetical protein Q7K45_04635, partial [Nanoarchaeota archaeon]|nr:hypothetical protein [Nanoarchaeota archaeon]